MKPNDQDQLQMLYSDQNLFRLIEEHSGYFNPQSRLTEDTDLDFTHDLV